MCFYLCITPVLKVVFRNIMLPVAVTAALTAQRRWAAPELCHLMAVFTIRLAWQPLPWWSVCIPEPLCECLTLTVAGCRVIREVSGPVIRPEMGRGRAGRGGAGRGGAGRGGAGRAGRRAGRQMDGQAGSDWPCCQLKAYLLVLGDAVSLAIVRYKFWDSASSSVSSI